MRFSRRSLLLGGSAAALGAAIPGTRRAAAQAAPTKVRFVGSAPVAAPYHSYLYAGVPYGLYAKVGVTPEFSWIAGSAAAMQVALSGDADIANLGLLDFVAAKKKIPSLPLKLVYCQDYLCSYMLAVPEDGPIKSVADMKGKTVGVLSLASGAVPYTKAMMRQAGLAASDVDFVAVGADAPAVVALKSGRVDALNFYVGLLAGMENRGVKFRTFIAQVPSAVFVASDKFLAANREAAVHAFQAIALNTIFSEQNPMATARSFYQQFGGPTGDKDAALRDAVHVIDRTMATHKKLGDDQLWGNITAEEWQSLMTFAGPDLGLPADTPIGDYFDSGLVADINKVDTALAVTAAKSAG